MGYASQVCLLMHKNWLLQKRRICVTIFEILLPVSFAFIFIGVRGVVEMHHFKDPIYFPREPVIVPFEYYTAGNALIGYAPATSETDILMTNALKMLTEATVHYNNISIKGFQTEMEAISFYKANSDLMHVIVVFPDITISNTILPKKMRYTLRPETISLSWETEHSYPPLPQPGPRSMFSSYRRNGIVGLQSVIGQAVTEYWHSKTKSGKNFSTMDVYSKRMAYPPYNFDPLINVLSELFPFFMSLSFILCVIINTKTLVYEKERKLKDRSKFGQLTFYFVRPQNPQAYLQEEMSKESMKLMGLTSAAQWTSWFLTFLVYLVPANGLYTYLFFRSISAQGPVLSYTDASLFFVFLICYSFPLITFCFMVSTFVHKANTGAILAGLLFYAFYFPFSYIKYKYDGMDKKSKIGYSLFFNCAMALGVKNICILEGAGEGAKWSNFYYPATRDDNFSLLEIMIVLLVDSVIYFLISWYVDSVFPGEFGVAEPYLFCVTKSYWFPERYTKGKARESTAPQTKYFEKEPSGREAGIRICNLRKTFGTKVAVAGTSLNMYEGQITVLLGHNGAGKTTTMSMLTGFIAPTSGTAIVNGYDIRENIAAVRSSLGLCPQHNILFDTLTVREHLVFFAKLKGYSGSTLTEEVYKMAKELGMENKINAMSHVLSGGQKRKLSVGIALIAGSKVVILDEPTAGMDPAARRQMWNVLQEARPGRTILLSTHYMDEADLLGDRIAIMAEGVVKCCGSSIFLKKLYGAGYHLVIVKLANCNVMSLTNVIHKFIPTAELETVINTEVTYTLPDNESGKFPPLFQYLDSNKKQLNISSFGTSVTTMEEVFLKVGECAEVEDKDDAASAEKSDHTVVIRDDVIKDKGGIADDGDFRLVVVKKENCDVERLTIAIQSYVPAAELVTITNTEVVYHFPANDFSKVEDVFNHLKREKEQLGIEVIEAEGTNRQLNNENVSHSDEDKFKGARSPRLVKSPYPSGFTKNATLISEFNAGYTKKTGLSLEMSRMRAIFVKKALNTWRQCLVTIPQLLLPVIFASLALSGDAPPKAIENPALTFDLEVFEQTHIPFTHSLNATPHETDFGIMYRKQFGTSHVKEYFDLKNYDTFDNYTVKRAADISTSTFNKDFIIGMEIINAQPPHTLAAVAYYNGQPFHAEPISVNYLMNTFLQFSLDETYSLQSAIHPLPQILTPADKKDYQESGHAVGLVLSLGMAFMTAFFIHFPIKERQVGAKHMQVISGVTPLTYWLPTFVWDFINYFIPSILIIVVFLVFEQKSYIEDGRWTIVLLVLVAYGWAILPFMYALQFAFTSPPTGVVVVVVFSLISGLVTTLTVSIVEIPMLNLEDTAKLLDLLFKIFFPNYNFSSCFARMNTNYYNLEQCKPHQNECLSSSTGPCCKDTCGKFCIRYEDNYLAWNKPGIGSYLVFMGLQGILGFLVVVCIEYHLWQKLWYKFVGDLASQPTAAKEAEDSDVAEERHRITSSRTSILLNTDSLVLANLYKRYKNYVAVNHICVGVPEKECFGLLGQNGAGKTTTFKMLTGDVMLTGGNAYLKGFDIKNNIKKVQANMGYCPQFDALIDQMTGRETLTMFGRLRGIPEENIKVVIKALADILTFQNHIDKPVGQYSGGNKRKMSTAVALIGDPSIIMLDEPSAGMDPEARRNLWNVLSQVRASGRTLVLTSHSMEECDALCTRIAIMVNGRFMCLGSPQHLKNKFGQGYTLTVKLGSLEDGNTAPNQPVVDLITERFPGAKVFDDHEGYIHFQVPETNVTIADVFSLMEETKKKAHVEDYSVHQTTLEQIFLTFTRTQSVPTEVKSAWICMPPCLS